MASKIILAICSQVLFVQTILGQYYNGLGAANGLGFVGGLGAANGLSLTGGLGAAGAIGLAEGIVNAGGLGVAGLAGGIGAINGLGSGIAVAGAPVVTNPVYLNLGSFSAGGVLPISSYGPIVPAGITVVSDNLIQGTVALDGQLPFLSAVAFDGTLPSGGAGAAQCGCGSAGNIGIISETVGPAAGVAPVAASAIGAGLAGVGLPGVGLSNVGLGRGRWI